MQCTCTVGQGPGLDTISFWIRGKEQRGAKSVGGLKVKAVGQTPRDVGLSPTWCSTFPALIFASRENI